MSNLLELLKKRNSLSINYDPYSNLNTSQKVDTNIQNTEPIQQQSQQPYIDPTIQQQYLKDMQEPVKPKGFFGNLKQAFINNPSLVPNLVSGITALTGGSPYLAGAMGEQGARMQQGELAKSSEESAERRARRAEYVKGAENRNTSLQEAMAKAQQAYELKGLELGQKEQEAEAKRQADLKKQEAEFAFKQAQQDKDLAFKEKKQQQDLAVESKKIANAIQKTKAGKILPATQATEIGDVVSSVEMLDNLADKLGDIKGLTYSPADIVKGANPWDTGAQNYKQLVAATKQVIGKGLEGGVLRKEDESKYEKIIPAFGDTKDVLQVKYNNLRDLLINKHGNLTTSLSQAGYNTENLNKKFNEPKTITSKKKQTTNKYSKYGI